MGDVHIPTPEESTTDHLSNKGAGAGRNESAVDKVSSGEKSIAAERRQSLTVMLFAAKKGRKEATPNHTIRKSAGKPRRKK